MTKDVSPDKICPVCGERYSEDQPTCSFCNIELTSNEPLEIGSPSKDLVVASRYVLERAQQEFLQAVLTISWQGGSFDPKLFETVAMGGFTENEIIKESFERDYKDKFFPLTEDDRSLILQEIFKLVFEPEQGLFLVDDGPDQITLAHITNQNDQLSAQFRTIPWYKTGKKTPPARMDLAVAGGYIVKNIPELAENIREVFTKLGAPSTFPLLLCSRLFNGKHTQIIQEALKDLGCQVTAAPYLIGNAQNFESYSEALLECAPLKEEIGLLGIHLARDGKVDLQFKTIFPGAAFLPPHCSNSATVRSHNKFSEQISLVLARRMGNGFALYQAKKAELPFGKEADLGFKISNRKTITLTGISSSPDTVILEDLLKAIPDQIAQNDPRLSLVVVVDTIGREEDVRDRCQVAGEAIRLLRSREDILSLDVSVIGYGDQHTRAHPIQYARNKEWMSMEEAVLFFDTLEPTLPSDSDYESALYEAMARITCIKWPENTIRWVLTFGKHKPHPDREIEGCSQYPSLHHLKWEDLVKTLKSNHVKSMAYIWPLEVEKEVLKMWPALIKSTCDFWQAFSYSSEFMENGNADVVKVVQTLSDLSRIEELELKLPEIISNSK